MEKEISRFEDDTILKQIIDELIEKILNPNIRNFFDALWGDDDLSPPRNKLITGHMDFNDNSTPFAYTIYFNLLLEEKWDKIIERNPCASFSFEITIEELRKKLYRKEIKNKGLLLLLSQLNTHLFNKPCSKFEIKLKKQIYKSILFIAIRYYKSFVITAPPPSKIAITNYPDSLKRLAEKIFGNQRYSYHHHLNTLTRNLHLSVAYGMKEHNYDCNFYELDMDIQKELLSDIVTAASNVSPDLLPLLEEFLWYRYANLGKTYVKFGQLHLEQIRNIHPKFEYKKGNAWVSRNIAEPLRENLYKYLIQYKTPTNY